MFEKFFDISKNPDRIEKHLKEMAEGELSGAVNAPSINVAFDLIKRENKNKEFGLTNDQLLDIVKESSIKQSTAVEDFFYGGHEKAIQNINLEIERLRNSLTK
jgi:hypothetical protein